MDCHLPVEDTAYNACQSLVGSCIGDAAYTGLCLRCIVGGSNGYYTVIGVISAYIGALLFGTLGLCLTWKYASYAAATVPMFFIISECFALVMQGCKVNTWHTVITALQTASLLGMRLPAFMGAGGVMLALFVISIGAIIGFIPVYDADLINVGVNWTWPIALHYVVVLIQLCVSSLRLTTLINKPGKYKNAIRNIADGTRKIPNIANNIAEYEKYIREAKMAAIVPDALYDYWGDSVGWCLISIPYLIAFGIYEVHKPFPESFPEPIYTLFKFRYIIAASVMGLKIFSVIILNIMLGGTLSDYNARYVWNHVIRKKEQGIMLIMSNNSFKILNATDVFVIVSSMLTFPACLLEYAALKVGKLLYRQESLRPGIKSWHVQSLGLEKPDYKLYTFVCTMSPYWCYNVIKLMDNNTLDYAFRTDLYLLIKSICNYCAQQAHPLWEKIANDGNYWTSFPVENNEHVVKCWKLIDKYPIHDIINEDEYNKHVNQIKEGKYITMRIIILGLIYQLRYTGILPTFADIMCTLEGSERLEWQLWLDVCYDIGFNNP